MEKFKNNKKVVILAMIGVFVAGIIGFVCLKNNKEDVVDVESFEVEGTGDVGEIDQGGQGGQGGQGSQGSQEKQGEQGNKQNQSENNAESLSQKNQIYIHIIGEVNNQGIIILEKGQRIVDAIEKAGGTTQKADLSKINLAYVLSDGQKVRIPSVNDKENIEYVTQNSGNNTLIEDGNNNINLGGGKVNINTATQTELETLTGIGPSLAARIIEYRGQNGKFKKVEELRNVKGIGQSKFDGIKEEVVVD